ncbi:MAG TPA: type II toxin-antitoxin system VapC family toxin [Thermoanaerobaculia bacterium]|nr:type II toxin-antitoxin system VapC family toxin [Thermoanaerobaculia bacterium]
MNVVVDASLPVAVLTDAGPDGRWATVVLSQSGLAAPHMMPVEVTNVLRRRELAGRLSRLEAGAGARDVLLLDVELLPFAPFAPRVWELRTNLTSYDAWYVAVAETFDVPLATLDRRLAASPGPRCRFLLPPR